MSYSQKWHDIKYSEFMNGLKLGTCATKTKQFTKH